MQHPLTPLAVIMLTCRHSISFEGPEYQMQSRHGGFCTLHLREPPALARQLQGLMIRHPAPMSLSTTRWGSLPGHESQILSTLQARQQGRKDGRPCVSHAVKGTTGWRPFCAFRGQTSPALFAGMLCMHNSVDGLHMYHMSMVYCLLAMYNQKICGHLIGE